MSLWFFLKFSTTLRFPNLKTLNTLYHMDRIGINKSQSKLAFFVSMYALFFHLNFLYLDLLAFLKLFVNVTVLTFSSKRKLLTLYRTFLNLLEFSFLHFNLSESWNFFYVVVKKSKAVVSGSDSLSWSLFECLCSADGPFSTLLLFNESVLTGGSG